MLAQLGQLGLGPGASPPGLLQMAQDAGRGSAPMPEGFRDDTGLVAHNIQLGRASQAGGDVNAFLGGITPGAPPAFVEQGSPYDFPSVFSQGTPGDWFTLNDYYKQRPSEPDNPGGKVPGQFMHGAGLPSTNNWRILPPQYRDPNYFMINGQIIDRRQIQRELHPSVLGQEGGTGAPGFGVGGASAGMPRVELGGGGGGFFGQLGNRAGYWGPSGRSS
jgi:hypothetical protein